MSADNRYRTALTGASAALEAAGSAFVSGDHFGLHSQARKLRAAADELVALSRTAVAEARRESGMVDGFVELDVPTWINH